MSGAPLAATDGGTSRRPRRSIRPDIEGLRAIAIGVVMLGHAGLPFLPGGFVGVDVFFVLSGFLITGLLIREVSETGHVSMPRFWARRMRRLLPASTTVLAVTALLTWLFLPITQRKFFAGDIVSSALYVVNWRLADRSVDYAAHDISTSPVQHYWSLAVEEQFYVLWPILMTLVSLVAIRYWKRAAWVVLGLVTLASFGYATVKVDSDPLGAYFVTTTRIWELGIGALLALAAVRVASIPARLRAVTGWVGLGMIALAAITLNGPVGIPGWRALLPTLGAALVIAAGLGDRRGLLQRGLSLPPMVWVGGLSYSLYLWHWPILIAARAEYPDLRIRMALLLMLASFVPAWLSHHLIENPLRFGRPLRITRRALTAGLAMTAVSVFVGLGLARTTGVGEIPLATPDEAVGAATLQEPDAPTVRWSDIDEVDGIRPSPLKARRDLPSTEQGYPACMTGNGTSKVTTCVVGDTEAKRTIAFVGDSKMRMWQPLLQDIGTSEGWRVVGMTKAGCPFTAAYKPGPELDYCHTWNRRVMRKLLTLRPEVVLTSQDRSHALAAADQSRSGSTRENMVDGLVSYWSRLTRAGIKVVAVVANPEPTNQPVYECVAQHPDHLSECSFPRGRAARRSAAGVQNAAAKQVDGVTLLDVNDTICPDGDRCAAVIGNVLVYRQGSHLTNTFVLTMADAFEDALYRATAGLVGAAHPAVRAN